MANRHSGEVQDVPERRASRPENETCSRRLAGIYSRVGAAVHECSNSLPLRNSLVIMGRHMGATTSPRNQIAIQDWQLKAQRDSRFLAEGSAPTTYPAGEPVALLG